MSLYGDATVITWCKGGITQGVYYLLIPAEEVSQEQGG